ncbi:MAG: hypothetical protein M1812_004245 [Candelaria pacifica]|nr:MAG: hypothetical protein M1812_004245 [Candelaria pacifica]
MTAVSKLSVVQAVVIKVLVDEVFNVYYFGMPEFQVAALKTMEGYLNPLSSAARVNHWRAVTLAIFRHSQNDSFKNQVAELWEWLQSRIDETLTALTGIECSDAWDKGLRSILDQAVEISHLFRIQRAEFQVLRPSLQNERPVDFDPEVMEDISGEDEVLLRGREIGCVTFPAVLKIGDETGDNVSCLSNHQLVKGVPINFQSSDTPEERHLQSKGLMSGGLIPHLPAMNNDPSIAR